MPFGFFPVLIEPFLVLLPLLLAEVGVLQLVSMLLESPAALPLPVAPLPLMAATAPACMPIGDWDFPSPAEIKVARDVGERLARGREKKEPKRSKRKREGQQTQQQGQPGPESDPVEAQKENNGVLHTPRARE